MELNTFPIRITHAQLVSQLKASADFIARGEDGSTAIYDISGQWLLMGSGDPRIIDDSGNGVWVDENGGEVHSPAG